MRQYLVRHARTEKRDDWDGPDALRPLSPRGLRQAEALAASLASRGLERVISSPQLRCRQTAEVVARAAGLAVELDARLAEGEPVKKALALLAELAETPCVVVSHAPLISALVTELDELGAGLELDGPLRCEKASIWTLEGAGSDFAAAELRYAQPPPDGDAPDERLRLGVIDLGSTSFRLVVSDATRAGRLERRVNERRMLRLGAAIALDGRIPEDVCETAEETARELGALAREAEVTTLLPVATAALRDASNGAELAARLGAALGAPVRVLSGEQEARLMFTAFRRRVLLGRGPALGIDLGGGSLELALGDAHAVHWETTLRIGVTRIHRELVHSDPLAKSEKRAIRERVREAVLPVAEHVRAAQPELTLAVGGTARAFARLAVARRGLRANGFVNQVSLSLDELEELTRLLTRADHRERLRMPGMRRSRADLLPAGGLVLLELARALELDGYTVCDWGLREGVMLEALGVPV